MNSIPKSMCEENLGSLFFNPRWYATSSVETKSFEAAEGISFGVLFVGYELGNRLQEHARIAIAEYDQKIQSLTFIFEFLEGCRGQSLPEQIPKMTLQLGSSALQVLLYQLKESFTASCAGSNFPPYEVIPG